MAAAASNGVPGTHASPPPELKPPAVLSCHIGDPTMFKGYWNVHKEDHVMDSHASEGLSYFAEANQDIGGLWFISPDVDHAVRELHAFVGNAVTENRSIVMGNGATQLFQAALHGLATRDGTSTPVVAESPYYSAYPYTVNYLQSKLFHWAGDSKAFEPSADEKFIEVVTSPNNPSGEVRERLVLGGNGMVVHDLAYYWPTFTPITKALDQDVMLFTLSKCTGHAGLRIGWAIVKDPEVAKNMAEFIVNNTLGTSQDAQIRAAGLLRAAIKGYEGGASKGLPSTADDINGLLAEKKFFHWGKAVMESRWRRVRDALVGNQKISIHDPSAPVTCKFLGTAYSTYPAFVWLKCEEGVDCLMLLKSYGILSRGGPAFGVSAQYTRLSLVDGEPLTDLLIERLAALK